MTDTAQKTLRVLAYARVSSDRHGQLRSVGEQLDDIRRWTASRGWEIVDEIVDNDMSASRYAKRVRPGWGEVLERLAADDIDVLAVWEDSRTTRELGKWTTMRDLLRERGILLLAADGVVDFANPGHALTAGVKAVVGEHEAEQTRARVKRAVRANAVAGRPHGRRLFGYRRIYDQTTGVLIGQEVDPEEAEVVRCIFQRSLEGAGIRTIAGELNDRGSRTQTGALWQDTQVRRVLINPAYAARRVHQGEVIGPADWEPIVDDDTFDRIAARFEQRRMTQTRVVKTARLLTGVGRCGKCGGKIACGHDRNGRKVYYCKSGHHVARDMLKLDEYISAVVVERLSRPDVADALEEAEDTTPSETERARAQVAELSKRLDSAVAQFTAGELTAATLGRIEQQLRAEIAELEQSIRDELVVLDFEVPDNVEGWWEALTPELRREVVNSMFAAIVILPSTKGSRRFDPDAVRIEWRR